MRSPKRLSRMAVVALSCVLLAVARQVAAAPPPPPPPPPAPGAPAPETPGDAGRRAFDDLAALYAEPPRLPELTAALRELDGTDPATRKAAGAYVLALFRQSFADES